MKKALVILAALPWLMAASVCVDVPSFPQVFDSNGDQVGNFWAVEGSPKVAFDTGGGLFAVFDVKSANLLTVSNYAYYSGAGCVGTVYVAPGTDNTFEVLHTKGSVGLGVDDAIYVGTGIQVSVITLSKWDGSTCTGDNVVPQTRETVTELVAPNTFMPPYKVAFE